MVKMFKSMSVGHIVGSISHFVLGYVAITTVGTYALAKIIDRGDEQRQALPPNAGGTKT